MQSPDNNWVVIPNFDANSRLPMSGVSGQVKRDADPGVIRPIRALIDHEGYFDLTFYDAEQLARLIGWVPVEEHDVALERIEDLEAKLVEAINDGLDLAADAIRELRESR